MDLASVAFEVMTGRKPPPRFLELVGTVTDPTELRRAILSKPAIFAMLPEFRTAHEIASLAAARRAGGDIRILVGAAGTSFPGWVSTTMHTLDLLKPETWRAYLEPGSVAAILSEHVWEHLDLEEGRIAATTCFTFLRPGGRMRLAVPDAWHPDPEYRAIAGLGGMHQHKTFYDVATLTEMLGGVGFRVEPLEYWTEEGRFVAQPWERADGPINRTFRFDGRNADGKPNFTSLLVDAWKPEAPG